ncbi:hypothetical protein RhiirA5_409565 [Rhizophagus irregularis]|uniref:Uncharacterized protein n=1 Tax=Rhizophagus irregularis TaxID=588596 RepID=A0A2N0S2D6_9GLOM|nr:hypothetical protein RhiirA5_424496 [Rhizophagus irregularis]PKC14296.1 hypothetical protein RhiirA5_409565 [Rhizophagus irregularis]PKC69711.1 hypothetical protein RhiirA1_455686 [Rhizophagus irregularis]GET53823.1 hypothetical protein RIR_jg13388.t2 [Rhizophagus irregularis DAOM 181602=DAOM 197198]
MAIFYEERIQLENHYRQLVYYTPDPNRDEAASRICKEKKIIQVELHIHQNNETPLLPSQDHHHNPKTPSLMPQDSLHSHKTPLLLSQQQDSLHNPETTLTPPNDPGKTTLPKIHH